MVAKPSASGEVWFAFLDERTDPFPEVLARLGGRRQIAAFGGDQLQSAMLDKVGDDGLVDPVRHRGALRDVVDEAVDESVEIGGRNDDAEQACVEGRVGVHDA